MGTTVVCLGGAGSRSGQVWEVFDGLVRYLTVAGGYARADFVEASYHADAAGAPRPYSEDDSCAPLAVATRTVARELGWIRARACERPGAAAAARSPGLSLLGWSLGGVVLFDAAVALFDADPTWARDLRSIVTLASPLLGSDVDGFDLLGAAAAGAAGADLAQRAADPSEKERVRDGAARLRAAGVRIVTLAAEEDAVVTPEDALLPAPGPEPSAFIMRPRRQLGGDLLGHRALPRDPLCWQRVLAGLGPASIST